MLRSASRSASKSVVVAREKSVSSEPELTEGDLLRELISSAEL